MLLNSLKRRSLLFFSEKKYPKGVYGLSQDAYELAMKPLESVSESEIPQKFDETGNWSAQLERNGYTIIENEQEAKDASMRLEHELKAGDILGTRGFDKRYYVASKSFYTKYSEKVRELLKKESLNSDALAEKTHLSQNASRVVLEIMREQGDLIEKKRGMYVLI